MFVITKGGWFVIKTREVWKRRHWTDLIIKPPNIFMKMGRSLHQSPERYHDHKKLRIAIKKMSFFILRYVAHGLHLYRPQRSCESYVFTRVCHFVHRGLVVSQHALQVISQHALQQGGVLSQHALQVVSQHALQQGDTCSWGVPVGGSAPRVCVETPPPPLESRRLLLRTVRMILVCILVFFIKFSRHKTIRYLIPKKYYNCVKKNLHFGTQYHSQDISFLSFVAKIGNFHKLMVPNGFQNYGCALEIWLVFLICKGIYIYILKKIDKHSCFLSGPI